MAIAKVTPPSSHSQSTTITLQRDARYAELTFLIRTLNPTSTQSCGATRSACRSLQRENTSCHIFSFRWRRCVIRELVIADPLLVPKSCTALRTRPSSLRRDSRNRLHRLCAKW
jgi:hypothetical protein